MYKQTSRLLAIAAATFALSMGAAHAQTQPAAGTAAAAAAATTAPAGGQGMHRMMHRGGGMHRGGFMMGMKKLHDKLHLNADQEKQWQTAVDTAKQNREQARKNFHQMKQQFDSIKNQPIIDMNALHTAHQQIEQQNAQLREQTAQAWLTFYNGLNDQQKTTVSTAFKERMAKMEQRREHMRERMHQRWEQHHAASAAQAQPAKQ